MAESTKTGSDEFGDLLRSARERLGMSRRDLAEATGLSYPYISQIETGYRMPSSPAMRSLAKALGLPTDSLFDAIPLTARRVPPPARSAAPAAIRLPASAAPPPPAAAAPAPADVTTEGAAAGAPPNSLRAGLLGAAGGGWIDNQHHAPSAGGRAGTGPAAGTLRVAAATNRDHAVDVAAGLLRSLPPEHRLDALAEVQSRVVRSVVDDQVRDAFRPE
jgi:transcriptional regulator with XRE-family HTH domain